MQYHQNISTDLCVFSSSEMWSENKTVKAELFEIFFTLYDVIVKHHPAFSLLDLY